MPTAASVMARSGLCSILHSTAKITENARYTITVASSRLHYGAAAAQMIRPASRIFSKIVIVFPPYIPT